MSFVTNTSFLKAVFGSRYQEAHVTGFAGDPYDPHAPQWRWRGARFGSGGEAMVEPGTHNNTYWCVSTFDPNGKRDVRVERMANCLHALTIDDVGDPATSSAKIHPDRIREYFTSRGLEVAKPSIIVETSPGNFQFVYLFDKPFEGYALAAYTEQLWSQVVRSLNPSGKDPGNGNLTRYQRLPVGINGKAKYAAPDGTPFSVNCPKFDPALRHNRDEWLTKVLGADQELLEQAKNGQAVAGGLGGRGPVAPVSYTDPDEDTTGWGHALNSRGLLSPAHKEGAWDIQCPFIDQHTDRVETGTAYLGEGHFKCHHGHCEDKESWEFQNKLEELYPGIRNDAARHQFRNADPTGDIEGMAEALAADGWRNGGWNTKDPEPDELLDRYVFLKYEDMWFDLATREPVARSAFNALYGGLIRQKIAQYINWNGKGLPPQPTEALLQSRNVRVAYAREYAPGRPPVFINQDRSLPGDDFRVVNMWVEPTVGTGVVKSRVKQITPQRRSDTLDVFKALVEQLTGDQGDKPGGMDYRLYNWMALLVAEPSKKPGWQWLFISNPGFGKDTLGNIVGRLVGDDNSVMVKQDDIASAYNAYAAKKFVIVNELSPITNGRKQGINMFDNIKPYLTAPPYKVTVNPKYGKQYQALNLGGYMFFSNHDIPMVLDVGERRLCVVDRRNAVDELRKHGVFSAIHTKIVYDPVGQEIVGQWLRERHSQMTQADFDELFGAAPDTQMKRDLINASKGKYEEMLEDWIEDAEGLGPLWTAGQLKERLHEAGRRDRSLQGLTMGQLTHKLKSLGAWKPAAWTDRDGRVANLGRGLNNRDVVWALYEDPDRGLTRDATLDPAVIRDMIIDQHAANERGDNVVAFRGKEAETDDLLSGLDLDKKKDTKH